MRLVDAGVTVKDRILLHLLDYWGRIPRGEWPEALTQDGIAGVVGISRSHVAVTIPDLMRDDMVTASVERVQGRARRVKVYGLTYMGGHRAGRLAQELLRTTVTAVDGSGEWDLPLDGLIQVHKVHMLVALRLVDEDNRVDLREAAEMVRPKKAPTEVTGGEGEEVPGVPDEGIAEVPTEAPTEAPIEASTEVAREIVGGGALPHAATVATAATTAAAATATAAGHAQATIGTEGGPDERREGPPALVPPTSAPPQWGHGHPQAVPAAGLGGPPQYGYQLLPPQAFHWSPLRHGSGRRPQPSTIAMMVTLGFLGLMLGVVLIGITPVTCIVLWIPLLVISAFLFQVGFRDLWAVGDRREEWTVGALSGLAFAAVTMVTFAAFGPEAVYDLLWTTLVLGVPSIFLMASSGHNVARRGSFALIIGPVITMAAMAMAVLDPEAIGTTGAMPVLMMAVGVIWSFMGWVMTRDLPGVNATSLVIGGGAIGVAVATLAGTAHLASEDGMGTALAVAVALWTLTAAYVALVFLLPRMANLRPDSVTAYRSLAVAGAVALLAASAIFIGGAFFTIGIVEAVIAVALFAMVVPDFDRDDRAGLLLAALGCLVGVATVLAVSVAV